MLVELYCSFNSADVFQVVFSASANHESLRAMIGIGYRMIRVLLHREGWQGPGVPAVQGGRTGAAQTTCRKKTLSCTSSRAVQQVAEKLLEVERNSKPEG